MINSLIVIEYSRRQTEPHTGFEVTGSACSNFEEAREEVERDNDEEQDINNKLVAFLLIDHADAGERALAAVLDLAIEADHNVQGVGIESLLTRLFMAGGKKALEEPEQ